MATDDAGTTAGDRTTRRPSRAALAWLAVICLIGVVQLARGQWLDAALFGGGAALVAVSAILGPAPDRPRARPSAPLVGGGAVVLVIALSVAPRHSAWAAIAVIIAGLAAAAIAWRRTPAPARGPRRWPGALRGLAWSWAIIMIVAGLWELTQVTLGRMLPGGRAAYPALSDLLDPLVTPPIGQTLFAVGWVALGLFLAMRGRRT